MNGFGRGEKKEGTSRVAVVTRESVGMTLLLFGAVLFLILATERYLLGDIGLAISAFFVGTFGFMTYPLLLAMAYGGFVLAFGKGKAPVRWLLRIGGFLLVVFLIVHTATAEKCFTDPATGASYGYGAYLSNCWNAPKDGIANGTGGGVLLGLVAYPVRLLLSAAGAYVVYALLVLLSLFFIVMATPLGDRIRKAHPAGKRTPSASPEAAAPAMPVRSYPAGFEDLPPARPASEHSRAETSRSAPAPAPAPSASDYETSRAILFNTDPASSYRDNLIYNRDSYFNSHTRRNSVLPGQEPSQEGSGEHAYGADGERTYAAPAQESYSERYSGEAETARPSMPRRVTEERPAVTSEGDFNYPQAPSYRAPMPPTAPRETRDFYRNDVPLSPAAPEQPAQDTSREGFGRTEPTRDAGRDLFGDTARDTSREGFGRTEPTRDAGRDLFGDTARDTSREGFGRTEPASSEQPAEPEQPSEASREASFRSLFSRATETSSSFTFPNEDRMRGRGERSVPAEPEQPVEPEEPATPATPARETRSNADLFDDDEDGYGETETRAEQGLAERRAATERTDREEPAEPAPELPKKKHIYKTYRRPSNDCFEFYNDAVSVSDEEIARNSETIVETLAGFRVEAEVVKVTCGSAVTRYDIDIPRNISVRTVIKHDAEIAMRLHARDGVNVYSNSEVGAISIEVPNSVRATVGIRSVLGADEYLADKPGALLFVIGKDVEGRNVCGNITKMKHLLVAGSTGSGKSVCLNAMIISLICKYSPEDLRLILIDPKKVEFAVFDGLPHLMINEIVADAQRAVTALNWAINEMERRYRLFEQKTRNDKVTVRNVDEYNEMRSEDEEKLAKIVIIVDELADLMSVAKKEIEDRIQRLAQKARAAGIHLVLATQRPSVDVITGVIKGNLPTRMAFRVIQEVDSRTIIDCSGAEKLLGNGDMLYRTEGMFSSLRVQGAFISSGEVQKVVDYIRDNNEAYFDDSVAEFFNKQETVEGGASEDFDGGAVNEQYLKALAIVVKLGQASISLIQRKCAVGYNHAGKIIEWMELMGYISPFDGKAKARTVLLTKEEYESKYGSLDE